MHFVELLNHNERQEMETASAAIEAYEQALFEIACIVEYRLSDDIDENRRLRLDAIREHIENNSSHVFND
jgi:hypothetical protein